METTDKIFTTDGGNSFANGAMMGASLNRNNDPALMAAMMNGGMNGQWNNPFVYLGWLILGRGWDTGNKCLTSADQILKNGECIIHVKLIFL